MTVSAWKSFSGRRADPNLDELTCERIFNVFHRNTKMFPPNSMSPAYAAADYT
jgi:hypothetical protein